MAAQEKKRLVFMGTPEFAAIILNYVLDWPGGEVVAVYTQPDRPCGRGQKCKASPVKEIAMQKGLPVFQPKNFKQEDDVRALKALAPDFLLVAAYGLILPKQVLDTARFGAVNVHASLLPKYRGAAPIQRAIMAGESATGITIMLMDEGMDTGPILLQRAMAIGIEDTAKSLHDDLAHLGGRLLVEALEKMVQNKLVPIPQPDELATYAPKLKKEEGLIDWNRPCLQVHNQIRALYPWPGAYFDWARPNQKKIRLHVYPGRIGPDLTEKVPPGTILGVEDNHIAIACADKIYLTPKVKPENSKALDGQSFYCGYLSKACSNK
jgi:methionyl-tRNA formyltransferase